MKRYYLLSIVVIFYAIVIILIIRHQIIVGNREPEADDDSYIIDNGPDIYLPVLIWSVTDTTITTKATNTTSAGVDTTTGIYYDRDIDQNYSRAFVHKKTWSVSKWDAKCLTVPLTLPVTTVYVAESQTRNCRRYLDCLTFVSALQDHDSTPYGDIQYNFVVTGQGSIFEGLSWDCKVHNKTVGTDAILVLLTGYSKVDDYYVSSEQYESLRLFLRYNVMMRKLSPTYTLKPVCCIVRGNNPGKNLYWGLWIGVDHFYYHCNNPQNCTNT